MSDSLESNARRSLTICSLFESEVLTWLLLRNWGHPLAEDSNFRDGLLETATEVLSEAASGAQDDMFIQGIPVADMNLIAALWYAESRAIEEQNVDTCHNYEARLAWLTLVRRAIPSCFCRQDDLPD